MEATPFLFRKTRIVTDKEKWLALKVEVARSINVLSDKSPRPEYTGVNIALKSVLELMDSIEKD